MSFKNLDESSTISIDISEQTNEYQNINSLNNKSNSNLSLLNHDNDNDHNYSKINIFSQKHELPLLDHVIDIPSEPSENLKTKSIIEPPENTNMNQNNNVYINENEDSEDICRYCLDIEPKETLFQPCMCKQKVHKECLNEARVKNPNRNAFTQCSECKYKFKISVQNQLRDEMKLKYKLFVARDVTIAFTGLLAVITFISFISFISDPKRNFAEAITKSKNVSSGKLVGIYLLLGLIVFFSLLAIYGILNKIFAQFNCRNDCCIIYNPYYISDTNCCCCYEGCCECRGCYCECGECCECRGCCGECCECNAGGGDVASIVFMIILVILIFTGILIAIGYTCVLFSYISKKHSDNLLKKMNLPIYEIANYNDKNGIEIDNVNFNL